MIDPNARASRLVRARASRLVRAKNPINGTLIYHFTYPGAFSFVDKTAVVLCMPGHTFRFADWTYANQREGVEFIENSQFPRALCLDCVAIL